MIYFTADTHFYHFNIIEFCNRPVPNLGWMNRQEAAAAMNEILIERWNERIRPDDEVYHLGDFAFCGKDKALRVLERLNGRKYWIRGNHDYSLTKKAEVAKHFEWIRDYYMLRVHDKYEADDGDVRQFHQPIALMHFPILSWDGMHHGTWMLHGHCHGSLPDTGGLRMDVGVDTNNLYPYSYEDVKERMVLRTVVPVDHHK